MTRWLSLALLVVAFGAVSAACGTDPAASAFVERRWKQLGRGEYAQAWETLHPAQQAIVTRDAFVACGQQASALEVAAVTILNETDAQADVPEIGPTSVRSVELRLRFKGSGDTRTTTDQLLKVNNDWRWVMSQRAIDAFKNGECPRAQ